MRRTRAVREETVTGKHATGPCHLVSTSPTPLFPKRSWFWGSKNVGARAGSDNDRIWCRGNTTTPVLLVWRRRNDDPARGMEIFQTIGDASQISVTVERAGQRQDLSLNLADLTGATGNKR